MMTFLVLLFTHLLADYPLQGEFLAMNKGKNHILLITHSIIWSGVICTSMWMMGFTITPFDAIWLCVVHAIADYMKAKPFGFYKNMNVLGAGLLIDQAIHIAQILILLSYKGAI